MSHMETILRSLLEEIAKENNYINYTLTIKPISSGGANYSSDLFVATLSASGKDDLNLFAKVAAIGEKMRALIKENIYANENYFYKDILKKYRQIEEKYNVPGEDRLVTAKFYAASSEYLHEILVLENLTATGFESFNRFQSIDWAYASCSIKQLAILHALSIAYSREDPAGYEGIVKSNMTSYPVDVMTNALPKAFDKAISSVREGNKGRLSKFLENSDIRKPLEKLYKASGLPVIIHSDYRPSNMMHKVQNDGTVQVIILDYQSLNEGCPVTDLLYFILLGSDKNFRDQYMQKSFELYYLELSAALNRFNIDVNEIYSEKTYQQDIKKLLPYMLSYSFYILLGVTIDENDAPKLDEGFSLDDFNDSPSKLYAERINDLVDDFIAMGIL